MNHRLKNCLMRLRHRHIESHRRQCSYLTWPVWQYCSSNARLGDLGIKFSQQKLFDLATSNKTETYDASLLSSSNMISLNASIKYDKYLESDSSFTLACTRTATKPLNVFSTILRSENKIKTTNSGNLYILWT